MVLPTQDLYTIKDIYELPDGKRAELIDGQIHYIAPPSTDHQRISNYLSTEINLYIRSKTGNCEVFQAPFAVFLSQDDKTYAEPDISVICSKDKINSRGCNGAPDWVVEIVSPGSRYMDYGTKLFKYQFAGVREYWIVDPVKKQITVWNWEENDMEMYTFSDSVKAGIYEDLCIDFSKINL